MSDFEIICPPWPCAKDTRRDVDSWLVENGFTLLRSKLFPRHSTWRGGGHSWTLAPDTWPLKWKRPGDNLLCSNLLPEHRGSLVPMPFPPPVFDQIQYAIKNWRRERPGNKANSGVASFPGRSRLQFLIAYCMQKRRGKAWEKESRAWRQVDVRVDTRGAVTDRCNSQTLRWSASSLPDNELYWHCLLNVTVSSSWTKYYRKDFKILRQAPPP